MVGNDRRITQGNAVDSLGRVVGAPRTGRANFGVVIVQITGTVDLVGAALGGHLNLAARRIIEVGCLVSDVDLDLFNALDGCRNHARRSTVGLGSAQTDKVR